MAFGCHGNSLENLDSMCEFANPENLTTHSKTVSISCTEMKLCLFECLAYLTIAGIGNFLDFREK